MTAMFNFLPELRKSYYVLKCYSGVIQGLSYLQAPIITDAGTPDLRALAAEIASPKVTAKEAEQKINVGIRRFTYLG
jgi:hypothetical protein